MQFLILRAAAEEEEATGLAGGGLSSTQYSVLDTLNPLLEYLQSERERERDKFCNKRRFDGQHIRLLMLPINAGRVIAKLP